jgi:hypothetical protein
VSTFGKIEKPLSVTFVSELNELTTITQSGKKQRKAAIPTRMQAAIFSRCSECDCFIFSSQPYRFVSEQE